jgi:glycerol-3-phosphate dehydrogenase (NAD(P)+)
VNLIGESLRFAEVSERVTILGDGAMATVCSLLLTAGGHEVTMWGAFAESIERLRQNRENQRLLPGVRVPDAVRLTAQDAEAFEDCTLILSAVPTQYMRSVWERLRAYVPVGIPIISVAKGIENQTLLRPLEVIAELIFSENNRRPIAALSGPNIAGEIARRLPATAVVASADLEFARRVQAVLSTDWFRIYTNNDVIGVELAGAMKNVIAIAAGVLDGMEAGNNAKAALVTRGLVEITRLGVAMGAREETFQGLAGLGDLITTCVSPEGRNRRVGEQIGRGKKLKEVLSEMQSVVEGVATTQSVMMLARRKAIEMPITQAVYSVIFEDTDPRVALAGLMRRDPKAE